MDIERVEQVRAVERLAHRRGLALMPRAGLAAADFVAARLPAGAQVLALAGPGNNGGDALVAATLLQARGYRVALTMRAGPGKIGAPPAARPAPICRLMRRRWSSTVCSASAWPVRWMGHGRG
ncbi:putative carbohydrate kinase [Bordetella pertussis]|nr:putative carbohydrate kinase [Bordetella pertussis]